MNKLVKIAIAFNIFLAGAFIYNNYSLWNFVNAEYPLLIASHWSPFLISAPHYYYVNGNLEIAQGIFLEFNYPFWIFWIAMAINLVFIIMLGKSKQKS